jgi:GIY-YIG catalytic domain
VSAQPGVPQTVCDALTRYHNEWRHPRLAPLAVSGLYDMFPSEPTTFNVSYRWHPREVWPNADSPGVYFVFDSHLRLIYVGQSCVLGRRLSQWFIGSSQCKRTQGTWRSNPRFIATVPVPRHFEALALEGFLIDFLGPPENTSLKRVAVTLHDAQACGGSTLPPNT